MGGSFHGGIFRGVREFAWRGNRISQKYLKNDKKLNKKQVFSTKIK